jgi:hypothetical protein
MWMLMSFLAVSLNLATLCCPISQYAAEQLQVKSSQRSHYALFSFIVCALQNRWRHICQWNLNILGMNTVRQHTNIYRHFSTWHDHTLSPDIHFNKTKVSVKKRNQFSSVFSFPCQGQGIYSYPLGASYTSFWKNVCK